MNRKPLILVVDDEPQILRVMKAGLPAHGYDIVAVDSGEKALEEFRHTSPDIIILDLVMPEISGIEVCRIIRQTSQVPIIILSAKGTETDKIAALDLGADDYITKPFGIGELLARVRAVLRRTNPSDSNILTSGDFCLNIDERILSVSGREIKLTPKEFDLLRYLVANAGKVLTHKALIQSVWGWESIDQVEYLRVFINQLRKKVEPDPHKPCYILTEPWVGYRFSSSSSLGSNEEV
ncbi:MAG: response regulator transcription factor [Blastocatellia bacterium]|nr:response regulator transcription factor [Blastocatellia bacterium]